MKIILLLAAALSFFGLITYNFQKAAVTDKSAEISVNEPPQVLPATDKPLVLVELFTSEGCSSCPPADRALALLEKEQPNSQAEIITLSLHVDYWNRLGWTDPFSSSLYSQRQGFYSNTFRLDGVYTPQMVVDGTAQFVGSDLGRAGKEISSAAKNQKAKVELAVSEGKLQVKISELPEHQFANVFLAIAEDNLSTAVKRGENGGQTLAHTSVVRELKTIGSIAAQAKSFETETAFQMRSGWKKENLKLVVFVQEDKSSKIIGVNRIKL